MAMNLRIKPAATISYMGEDTGYNGDTLQSAIFCMPASKQSELFKVMDDTESLSVDEIFYRLRHTTKMPDIVRAEAQSLKQYMMMVDLWECPLARITNTATPFHEPNVITTVALIYFGIDQEYTGQFIPNALAYTLKSDETKKVRTMPVGMLYDFAFNVPQIT